MLGHFAVGHAFGPGIVAEGSRMVAHRLLAARKGSWRRCRITVHLYLQLDNHLADVNALVLHQSLLLLHLHWRLLVAAESLDWSEPAKLALIVLLGDVPAHAGPVAHLGLPILA